MKQINNGFCSNLYLTEEGYIYNADTGQYKAANNNIHSLKITDGSRKRISLNKLYKMVYNKSFCNDSIENLTGEEWKEIDRTEGVYFVSNLGRVKSYAGYEAIILKPTLTAKGYCRLDIIQEGQRATKFIHRLVAAAFLLPPKTIDMQLHHKDFNKQNNAAVNLEWLSIKQHTEKHNERRVQQNNGHANGTEPKNDKS